MIGRAELIIVLMRERGDAVVGDWDGVGDVDSSGKVVYAPPRRGTFGEDANIGFGSSWWERASQKTHFKGLLAWVGLGPKLTGGAPRGRSPMCSLSKILYIT